MAARLTVLLQDQLRWNQKQTLVDLAGLHHLLLDMRKEVVPEQRS